jgi:hypothetical protein
MPKHAFMLVLIATLAALPSAHAGIETPTTNPSAANISTALGAEQVLAGNSSASPRPEAASADGGAFFSPFAASPTQPDRRQPESARDPNAGGADLTLSVAASLAAVAAFAYLLRRASR